MGWIGPKGKDARPLSRNGQGWVIGGMCGRSTAGHERGIGVVFSGHPVDDVPPAITTVLRIEGWDLPATAAALGQEVRFHDPHVEFMAFLTARPSDPAGQANRKPALVDVRVRLHPGVRAGAKPFTIANSPAVWDLQFDETPGVARFLHVRADGTFLPTRLLIHGQRFQIECELDGQLPFTHRLVNLVVDERARQEQFVCCHAAIHGWP